MEENNLTGIVMATTLEAEPFLRGFSLRLVERKPFRVYSHDRLFLVLSGIGKACAAMASSYLITRYGIGTLFNAGAAGAVRGERKVGDILHIDRILEYDRPKILTKGLRFLEPDVLKGFVMASLATQDRPVLDPLERNEMAQWVDLVDMEGAAFLQACRLFKARAYLFKIVSDTPEHVRDADIIGNIKLTRKDLFDFLNQRALADRL